MRTKSLLRAVGGWGDDSSETKTQRDSLKDGGSQSLDAKGDGSAKGDQVGLEQ